MSKKRGQGEGSVSKRADGIWCARVTVGRNSDGKQKRKAFYGKTRSEAVKKMTVAINALNNGVYTEPSKMTLGEWLDVWFEEYAFESIKASTRTSYEDYIEKHIKPVLGNIKLAELRGDIIQKFYNDKLADGRLDGRGGLSPKSIKNLHNMLHAALEQAYKNGAISKNISETTTLPKIVKKEMRVLCPDEQKKITEAAKNNRLGLVVQLSLATGMRLGEILALTWGDIDFLKESLAVKKTISRRRDYGGDNKTRIYIEPPKTKKSMRVIPLDPVTIKALKEHKHMQETERLSLGEHYSNNNFVFASQFGTPIEPRTYHDTFKKIVADAGINDANFHALRHTFATRGLEIGIPAKIVSEILGHASVSTTLDLYSHVSVDTKREAINKMAKFLEQ